MWDDFDDDNEWDKEDEFGSEEKKNHSISHPLMKKALEIISLTHALVGSLDEARKELYGGIMMQDASVLATKFSGAEEISDFVLKMEYATLMKIHAKSLLSMTYQLAVEETHAEEHLSLLRVAIREFKEIFVNWIQTFDPTTRQDDGWGLFL